MRIGVVILPEHRWGHGGRAIWQRAEELGFDHAWTYDHLNWRTLRDSPWFGAVPTLAAAAAVTTRIRLGTLVASPNFRHPVPFARELLSLDDLSGGRFTLGIGAGGVGWDATILGNEPWSPRERTERFAEFVDLLDRLLREREVSFTGTYYAADEARSYPGCIQQPRVPFAVAGTGPRAMDVVARHASTWVTTGDPAREPGVGPEQGAADVAVQLGRMVEACERAGRDPATVDRLVLFGPTLDAGLASADQFQHTIGRYSELGVTDVVVHWPREGEPYAGDAGAFEDVITAATGRTTIV